MTNYSRFGSTVHGSFSWSLANDDSWTFVAPSTIEFERESDMWVTPGTTVSITLGNYQMDYRVTSVVGDRVQADLIPPAWEYETVS